jgi:SAM-dependent MidA family methyltransferase
LAPNPTRRVDLGADFGGAGQEVAARIRRHGPLPFDEVVDLALYHPTQGFYSKGGAAGRRRGDFITSPEVGALFGAVLARAFDQWWRGLGEPDPFVVIDCGAGTGTLANGVRLAEPECLPALTYALVERSPALRARHADHLSLAAPQLALGPHPFSVDDDRAPAERGTGPRFVSVESMPALPIVGVVLANELLDNLPFGIVERRGEEWLEVRVGIDERQRAFAEHLVPAPERTAREADALVPDAPDGARFPIEARATRWLRSALSQVERGRVVVIDYAATTPELARRPSTEWLRTYRLHERGGPPLEHLGEQDITADVCIDQLARVRRPDRDQSQAAFLREHGIAELVEEGRRVWHERAAVGDLEAVRGRSRINEGEALTDPSGLGSFAVLEWQSGSG